MSEYVKEFPSGTSTITIQSDGWSGNVVRRRPSGVTPDYFQFDYEFTFGSSDPLYPYEGKVTTLADNKGYIPSGNSAIVGISLEHMGELLDGNNNKFNQFQGMDNIPGMGYPTQVPAWGGDVNGLSLMGDDIYISHYETQDPTDGTITEVIVPHMINVACSNKIDSLEHPWEEVGGTWSTTIHTDLPIFLTDADLLEYIVSEGAVTDKILNAQATPEETYIEKRSYWYVKNTIGKNTNNISGYTAFRNYRFFTKTGRICFYRTTPTSGSPWNIKLLNYSSYTVKRSDSPFQSDDDDYTVYTGSVDEDYLWDSISLGDDDYTVFTAITNIPIFRSRALAEQYINYEIDIRQADNYQQISRQLDDIVDPGWGDPDPGDDNGYNGMVYTDAGNRMWVMSTSELRHFFSDIFDPVHINDLLDGVKLFGSETFQAIQGISYYPCDITKFCDVYSTSHAIMLGSYQLPTATGKYIIKNDKLWEVGSVYIAPVYNDFRDFQIRLFLQLPYCGTHELDISKYLMKNLKVCYSCDVTSGACTAHIYANNIELDSFDGFMASSRPITAFDQQGWINSAMSAVSAVGQSYHSLDQYAVSAAQAMGGNASAGASLQGLPGAAAMSPLNTLQSYYGVGKALGERPTMSRGAYSACLGMFGNQKVHIISAQKKSYAPENLGEQLGFPSSRGATVGSFSGYLSLSSFQIANGFTGSKAELTEIYDILAQGIYI